MSLPFAGVVATWLLIAAVGPKGNSISALLALAALLLICLVSVLDSKPRRK